MMLYCWKIWGLFLSLPQRNAGRCSPVKPREKLAVCSFVLNAAAVKNSALAWNGCLHAVQLLAMSDRLCIISSHALHREWKAAVKFFLQEHVCDSSALHMRVRCGWLAVWWREVGEISQQLLHQEFYGFSYTQTSQIWGYWISWAYFKDQSESVGLSQGLRGHHNCCARENSP